MTPSETKTMTNEIKDKLTKLAQQRQKEKAETDRTIKLHAEAIADRVIAGMDGITGAQSDAIKQALSLLGQNVQFLHEAQAQLSEKQAQLFEAHIQPLQTALAKSLDSKSSKEAVDEIAKALKTDRLDTAKLSTALSDRVAQAIKLGILQLADKVKIDGPIEIKGLLPATMRGVYRFQLKLDSYIIDRLSGGGTTIVKKIFHIFDD